MNSISTKTLEPLLGNVPTLEEMRDLLIDSWGSEDYTIQLEKRVKERNPILFLYFKNNPTYSPVYEVISQLYKNEEWLWLVEMFLTSNRDLESHLEYGTLDGRENHYYQTN